MLRVSLLLHGCVHRLDMVGLAGVFGIVSCPKTLCAGPFMENLTVTFICQEILPSPTIRSGTVENTEVLVMQCRYIDILHRPALALGSLGILISGAQGEFCFESLGHVLMFPVAFSAVLGLSLMPCMFGVPVGLLGFLQSFSSQFERCMSACVFLTHGEVSKPLQALVLLCAILHF